MRKVAAFIVLKLLLLLALAAVSPTFVSYLGNFSFPDILQQAGLPAFIRSFANFDGVHFVKIASEGYYRGGYAFFPLYPLLIHILYFIFLKNHILAALFISNTAFLIGCWYAYELMKLLKISRTWFFVFLCVFPSAFFFQTAYSESLFFMIMMAVLFYLKKEQAVGASLSSALAALTRLVGGFLTIPLFFHFFPLFKTSKTDRGGQNKFLSLVLILLPLSGLVVYMCYQWWAAGDPLTFVKVQPEYGAGRSLAFITLPQVYFRYLKILLTASHNFTYFVAAIELVLFTFVIFTAFFDTVKWYRTKDNFLFSIGLFSLVSMIFPTFTGTFLSTPRFALLSLSTFLFLADIKNLTIKIALATSFAVLQIILFIFFIQGYFVS